MEWNDNEIEIRAQQEANKGLSQEEKQAPAEGEESGEGGSCAGSQGEEGG